MVRLLLDVEFHGVSSGLEELSESQAEPKPHQTMTEVNGSASYTDVPVDHEETWKCKAAVLTAYNTPLEIKEIEVGPLRDGECLVQIVAGALAQGLPTRWRPC
jgi:hypothetical protein